MSKVYSKIKRVGTDDKNRPIFRGEFWKYKNGVKKTFVMTYALNN